MKRILYLCGNLFPLHSGDSIYSYSILERLTSNYKVDLISLCQFQLMKDNKVLSNIENKLNFVKLVNYKISYTKFLANVLKYGNDKQYDLSEFKLAIHERLKKFDYDYIVVDHLRLAYLYKSLRKVRPSPAKLVLVQHNIEFSNFLELRTESKFWEKFKLTLCNYNLKEFEHKALKQFDYLWCISEGDKSYFDKITKDSKKSVVIPPYFQYKSVKSSVALKSNSYNLLFLGSMFWYPNIHGITWFIDNVFNKLLEKDNRYKLYIVGNSPSVEILKRANNNIIVTGRVEDVDEYIKRADLMIVPLFKGGGVKIKVMESIMKGLPVIATKESTKGYPEKIFSGGFCANTPKEFVASIMDINEDYSKKISFIQQGREYLKGCNTPLEFEET